MNCPATPSMDKYRGWPHPFDVNAVSTRGLSEVYGKVGSLSQAECPASFNWHLHKFTRNVLTR